MVMHTHTHTQSHTRTHTASSADTQPLAWLLSSGCGQRLFTRPASCEQALAWLIHSVAASRAAFVCKLDDATMPESTREYPRPPEITLTRLDDDTMPHLPNLARSSALQARRAQPDSLHSGAP